MMYYEFVGPRKTHETWLAGELCAEVKIVDPLLDRVGDSSLR